MAHDVPYQINDAHVINDTIDGEVVIVNLTEGNYYTLDAVAGEIWTLLQQPRTLAQMVAEISRGYGVSPEHAQTGVEKFWQELVEEQLVCPAETPAVESPGLPEVARSGYQDPSLRKYTDMQDMLVFDPIHDVEEDEGWPAISRPAG